MIKAFKVKIMLPCIHVKLQGQINFTKISMISYVTATEKMGPDEQNSYFNFFKYLCSNNIEKACEKISCRYSKYFLRYKHFKVSESNEFFYVLYLFLFENCSLINTIWCILWSIICLILNIIKWHFSCIQVPCYNRRHLLKWPLTLTWDYVVEITLTLYFQGQINYNYCFCWLFHYFLMHLNFLGFFHKALMLWAPFIQ